MMKNKKILRLFLLVFTVIFSLSPYNGYTATIKAKTITTALININIASEVQGYSLRHLTRYDNNDKEYAICDDPDSKNDAHAFICTTNTAAHLEQYLKIGKIRYVYICGYQFILQVMSEILTC
ncbi:MAG: hypothetical protein M1332_02700 [Deltaproteobacteria bacterium]|nr:hypothetical protein [Deltaproteobacteria bacterium]